MVGSDIGNDDWFSLTDVCADAILYLEEKVV